LFAVLDLLAKKQFDKKPFIHVLLQHSHPHINWIWTNRRTFLIRIHNSLWLSFSVMFGAQQGGQRTNIEQLMILLRTKFL